jgi:plasmid stabilization system protein ParE
MKIIWSPRAKKRTKEYGEYIAQDNIEAAEKWVAEIIEKVERIIEFPEQGRIVPEDGRANVREIFYKSHRIVYRITSKNILVLTIRHVKQLIDVEEL